MKCLKSARGSDFINLYNYNSKKTSISELVSWPQFCPGGCNLGILELDNDITVYGSFNCPLNLMLFDGRGLANLLDFFNVHLHQLDLIVVNKGNNLEFLGTSANTRDPDAINDIKGKVKIKFHIVVVLNKYNSICRGIRES